MLMILGLLNPAPTDAHIFAIPCLDTLADQNTHLLRQHPPACLLDHRSEPRERACHRRIRSRPGQVIGQIRLWNELQRVTVLEMANHLLARRRAQQAPAQSLQRRRQRQKRIPQKHIDHAVDIVEGDRAADDLWGIVMRKWWLQNPTHIGCPVCQYPLNECMKLLMVDAVVVTSKDRARRIVVGGRMEHRRMRVDAERARVCLRNRSRHCLFECTIDLAR